MQMNTSLLTREQIELGYNRFLAKPPDATTRVRAVTLEHADTLGVDLGELRRVEAAQALNESAANRGVDGFEYLLRFAIDTESEREQLMQAYRESTDRVLRMK